MIPENNSNRLTDKNLDHFEGFLSREMTGAGLAEQIPSGAHLFHGSYSDTALTEANLKLSSKILLGMTLGFVEEAPLMMVYEYQPGLQKIINLSSEPQKHKARGLIEVLQEQNQREVSSNLNELQAA